MPVSGDELTGRDRAGAGPQAQAGILGQGSAMAGPNGVKTAPEKVPEAGTAAVPPGVRPAHIRLRRPRGSAGRWLSIFAGSLGLFLIRFLVPTRSARRTTGTAPG